MCLRAYYALDTTASILENLNIEYLGSIDTWVKKCCFSDLEADENFIVLTDESFLPCFELGGRTFNCCLIINRDGIIFEIVTNSSDSRSFSMITLKHWKNHLEQKYPHISPGLKLLETLKDILETFPRHITFEPSLVGAVFQLCVEQPDENSTLNLGRRRSGLPKLTLRLLLIKKVLFCKFFLNLASL